VLVGDHEFDTAEAPVEIPTAKEDPEAFREVAERLEGFRKSLREGKEAEITLSPRDINLIVANDPEAKNLRGRIAVRGDGDRIHADFSVPLSRIPGFSGRWLNGTASLRAGLANGVLFITLDDALVNGKRPPAELLNALRTENLARKAYEDEEVARILRNLKDVRIEDGVLKAVSGGSSLSV